MRKNSIQQALNELIEERISEHPLAPRLVMGQWADEPREAVAVNIAGIRVLAGLNILAESLIKELIEQSVFGRSDVWVEQRVNPDMQPELHAAGISNVAFCARLSVVERLPQFYETVGHQVRYLLNAVQANEIYNELFPAGNTAPRGVLFPFHRGDESDQTGFFYLVEHVPAGRFLRITLESSLDARLRLSHIPHATVPRIDLVQARVDIPGTASLMAQGIAEACLNRKWRYHAARPAFDDFLRFLNKAGLQDLEVMSFSWPAGFIKQLAAAGSAAINAHVVRILYVLGNSALIGRLLAGHHARLDDSDFTCFLDVSQRNRCLNLSLMQPRLKSGLPECLDRMPAVIQTASRHPDAFKNTSILLIHHLTSEVLGFIQALAEMGARSVDTLWVKYAGIVEPDYKEMMLSLPDSLFRFWGLTPVPEPGGIQERFVLSGEFSDPAPLAPLAERLNLQPIHFFEAMQTTAGYLFFNAAAACRQARERLLVIEDGGYIAPAINRLCLNGKTLREAASLFAFPTGRLDAADLDLPLADWLAPLFPGSVEHTRNGYDALSAVETEHGRLAFPALSIAISNFKVHSESRDVAYSCLNAIENIMTPMGFALSERTALVLGAQGAIGRKTMRFLSDRLGPERLFGVDRVRPPTEPGWTFAETLDALPENALRQADLVFGVIGASICRPDWIERLLLATEKKHIFLASGSTKTVEFSHLTGWISDSLQSPRRLSNGQLLDVSLSEIHDPKTGTHLGRSARLHFGEKTVFLHLTADLMPVNFLYYGVPSETMNHVMSELLDLSARLAQGLPGQSPFPPRLLALDHNLPGENR